MESVRVKEILPTRSSVLLIEDDADYFVLIRQLLPSQRWELRHVETLAAGEAYLRSSPAPDVILLDMLLPDGDGLKALGRLQVLAPHTAIVLLTSMAEEEFGRVAIEAGAEDFLSKSELSRSLLTRTLGYAQERRRRTRSLQRQAAEIQQIFVSHPDALLVVSAAGIIESASQTAAALLGSSVEALQGMPSPFRLQERQPSAFSVEDITGATEGRLLEVVSSQVQLQDREVWLCAVRDISAREQLRALQEQRSHADRMATLGQFAAGMAHELNNPATVLLSNLEMMREDLSVLRSVVSPSGRRLLENSEELLGDSLDTMHRIIEVSRALQGLSRTRGWLLRKIELNPLVQRCCTFTRYRLRHIAQLQLSLQPLPPIVVDEEAISQLLLNLLLNATEAIPEGAPLKNRITVSTAHEGDWIWLEVSDTGPGVPEELRERIFEPFFTTREERGTGLGLALARLVAHRHRGEIVYQPNPGGGACFQLRLPAHTFTASSLAPPPAPEPVPEPTPTLASLRVLLIDDESLLREAMARLLQPECSVVTVSGGREAQRLLQQDDDFDAIVSDLMMPDIDGAALAEWLREQHPRLYPRLLIYTGGAVTDRLRRFVTQTDRPVLFKPLTRSDLLLAISQLSPAS